MKRRIFAAVLFAAVAGALAQTPPARALIEDPTIPPINVSVTIDAANSTGPLKPIWRWCGYDEPNYTYAPNGKTLVGEFQGDKDSVLGPAHFRAHNLLVTGDGTPKPKWGSTNAYTEDAAGKPVYDWTILDKIFDTYNDAGAVPYVEIGFMPKALSLRPDPYEHNWTPERGGNLYTGWTSPPNDYDKWRELNFQWAKHCVDRYGMEKVKTWSWEVWNEYNIGYFTAAERGGNKDVDYQKLYDYAADGITKAIPGAIIGGPESAGAPRQNIQAFVEHCINGTNFATGRKGSPLGLMSFHAKGNPAMFQGNVRMGISSQLNGIQGGFGIVTSRAETKNLPIVIGESDPDSCAGCAAVDGRNPQYGYRSGTLFSVYTIEQLARTMDLAERDKANLAGAVTWAFEFENQPIFGGFRALSTDGIELPVLNTFRMLNKMAPKRLGVKSDGDVGLQAITTGGVRGAKPDVFALASRDDHRVTIIVWNYHDDDVPGPAANVSLNIAGLPAEVAKVKASEWRIDETHSNAFSEWKKLGSPKALSPDQRKEMQAAAALAPGAAPADMAVKDGNAVVEVRLPRQAISMWELSW